MSEQFLHGARLLGTSNGSKGSQLFKWDLQWGSEVGNEKGF
jgi:hypothetical protein